MIPVVEEELRVGKRDVDQGGVKVKSHVVETPVTEEVNLQQERVSVERRPVDRPLSADERAFQDRTIEVEQKGQEAVVSKKARVHRGGGCQERRPTTEPKGLRHRAPNGS